MKMKLVWRTLLAIFFLALTLTAIVIAINWNDEPLRPEVEAALNWQAPAKIDEDNGYLLVLGFNAKEGVDPVQLGKRKLQEEIERYKVNIRRAEPEFPNTAVDKDEHAFTRPKEETCDYAETENCVRFYLALGSEDEQKILKKQERILDHLSRLVASPNYVEITPPHLSASIPSFSAVMHAAELERMRAIRMIAEGKSEEGSARLFKLVSFSQNWLAQSESLISYMIALAMVQRDLRVMDELMRAYPEKFNDVAQMQAWLGRFSMDRMGIQRALEFESRYSLRIMSEVRDVTLQGETNLWERRFASLFMQRNVTLNLSYDWHAVMIKLLQEPSIHLDQKYQRAQEQRSTLLGFGIDPIYVRNPIAKILMSVSEPAYPSYIEKQYDTFAQIHLLSLKLAMMKQQISMQAAAGFVQTQAASFPNPYDGSALGWDEQKQELFVTLRQPANQLYHKAKEFRLSMPSQLTQQAASVVEAKPKT